MQRKNIGNMHLKNTPHNSLHMGSVSQRGDQARGGLCVERSANILMNGNPKFLRDESEWKFPQHLWETYTDCAAGLFSLASH